MSTPSVNSGSVPVHIRRYKKLITAQNTPAGVHSKKKRDGRVKTKSKANGSRALISPLP